MLICGGEPLHPTDDSLEKLQFLFVEMMPASLSCHNPALPPYQQTTTLITKLWSSVLSVMTSKPFDDSTPRTSSPNFNNARGRMQINNTRFNSTQFGCVARGWRIRVSSC
eukprot:c13600_g1_i1.p3 GENE.c13600_g1_i1~~c13600_g1_i1.p3  ORF type:complete len:110 (-),score=22.95 c13600_g1_i1:239-568(-)